MSTAATRWTELTRNGALGRRAAIHGVRTSESDFDSDSIFGAWRSARVAVPVVLGLAGASFALLLGQATPPSIVCTLMLLAAGAASAHYLNRAHIADLVKAMRAGADDSSHLRKLCERGLPVWARQIQTSRETADQAMANLTRNFGDMVERLSATLSAAKYSVSDENGRAEDVVAIINRSEAQLARVVEVLQELHHSKDAILEQVRGYAGSLQDMAADVRQIALQIRLLALNGAIEASRAGEAGKAFAVVVGEMRQLSGLSSEMGDRISKKVDAVNASLAGMFGDGASIDAEAASIEKAGRDVESVTARFKDLTNGLSHSIRTMEAEGEQIKVQISDALVDFQFQDRISQILNHAALGMTRLGDAAERREEEALSVEAWLGEMASSYTTHEEFDNLQGKARGTRAAHGVTYF
jgi:methyl-accepting chemotaxis protein